VAHRGGIVVLATHDPELAERCDHVVRLADGQLAAAG
jgi:putative ABC transport system ATP-binding protein